MTFNAISAAVYAMDAVQAHGPWCCLYEFEAQLFVSKFCKRCVGPQSWSMLQLPELPPIPSVMHDSLHALQPLQAVPRCSSVSCGWHMNAYWAVWQIWLLHGPSNCVAACC
jgi:hypothetical protein